MAAGKSHRPRRPRGQDPRGVGTQGAGPAEGLAGGRRLTPVLDAAAAHRVAGDLLARRPWTATALTDRLRRRGAPAEVARAVVDDLVGRGYVDDATFARHWVASRAARGYGVTRLRNELRARGVAAPHIAAALGAIETDASLDRARDLARRRLTALRRGRPERLAARLRDYLLRRGFGSSVTGRVVRELTGAGGDQVQSEPHDG